MQARHNATEFGEITRRIRATRPLKVVWYRSKAHYDDFLLVVNTNLPPILHRFRDIAFDRSKIAIFGYPSCV